MTVKQRPWTARAGYRAASVTWPSRARHTAVTCASHTVLTTRSVPPAVSVQRAGLHRRVAGGGPGEGGGHHARLALRSVCQGEVEGGGHVQLANGTGPAG